eukprot:COSAG02_NODE_147_length_33939_cov_6.689539_10_plen_86_part_00
MKAQRLDIDNIARALKSRNGSFTSFFGEERNGVGRLLPRLVPLQPMVTMDDDNGPLRFASHPARRDNYEPPADTVVVNGGAAWDN